MTNIRHELESLANSVFTKQKADLVILGRPDSSGVPVETRREDIRFEHEQLDYRLVPVETLTQAVIAFKDMSTQYQDALNVIIAFQNAVPQEQWPESMRRAADLFGGS